MFLRLMMLGGLLLPVLACGGKGAAAHEQPEVCGQYIECAAVVAPTDLGTLYATYGDEGTCWTQGEDFASTCQSACENGIAALLELAPDAEECGGDRCADSADNEVPVAEAGSSISARIGETVQLDGSASLDPEGKALTYHWSFDHSPDKSDEEWVASSFSDNDSTTAVAPSFFPDVVGVYVLLLVVDDCIDDSANDYVIVTVQ